MNKILDKMWHTSPSSVYQSLKKVFQDKNVQVNSPNWHKISQGYGQGLEIFVDASKFSGWNEMIEGHYDNFLFDTLKQYRQDLTDRVIWDVGAHFGYSSMVFAKMIGANGRVISFEPNPYNIKRLKIHLRQNAELANRIEVKQLALSNVNGYASFSISSNVEGSQSTGSHLSGTIAAKEETVYKRFGFHDINIQTVRGDDLLINEKLLFPDVIKIDVEGAERLVLEGCPIILSKKPILLIEIHNVLAMYDTLSILYKNNYETEVVERDNATLSRCFIVALQT